MTDPGTRDNLAVRLLAGSEAHPGRTAIRQADDRISYAALAEAVRTTAATLRAAGVGPGDRVALLFGNHHRFVEALLGVIWAGAVAVPLNTRAGRTALQHVMSDAAPAVLLSHGPLAERARELAGGARLLLAGQVGWDDGGTGAPAPSDGDRAPAPVHADDVCLQPYTSGSTGNPKGCLLTHGGQHWNASTVAQVWELQEDDRGLITAPIYHKNAMICVIKPLLLTGGTIVIGRGPDPAGIPAEVAEHRCTYTTGVPATYEMLLASGEHTRHDLGSLRFVICGSAPLSEALGRSFAEGLGAPVIEAYGLTEGGPQVLMNPRTATPRYGLAGRPMPGGEVHLLDVEEMPATPVAELPQVPTGQVGEMWVRNPGVTAGYHRLPEVTRERISVDGWLRTGDLAVADDDGYFRVLGRADDMMNVGGENVYPLEVEQLLRGMPGVQQAAVVPAPHTRKGQVPVAFVAAEGLTEAEVKEYALANGAAHAHPRRVWFLDALPLGGTGKIDYARLAALVREHLADRPLGAAADGEDRP
ncbi:class I adenylate-forming enzyme family protein [Georgenia alba]|uniref:Class I adenylate-forming enzyme family protein n=1 Tax=Georgenia alba TaxID=2233858 RepID=A0ABW2QDX4_9MICO